MQTKDLLSRIDSIIEKGRATLSTKQSSDWVLNFVDSGLYMGFRSAALSFISGTFGEIHPYYKEFYREVNESYVHNIEKGINILNNMRDEINQGWLIKIKELVAAEVFSDFLEMSKYFLDEHYKDPAAVMIGSVLEEHLKRLCQNHGIDTFIIRGTDTFPKKADQMNADLTRAGVYGVLEQKSVTAWLDLRNKAAHGKYSEYVIEQVNLMYQGVLDFVTRIN